MINPQNSQDGIAWAQEMVRRTLPERAQDSHKGVFGTALLVAGGPDMPGAALISGLGALTSGVGKLEIGTYRETIRSIAHAAAEATYVPDALIHIANGTHSLTSYKAIACGPGVVPDALTEAAIDSLLKSSAPLILDAGALSERSYAKRSAPLILTPHAGEFSRISGYSTGQIAESPGPCASAFATEHHLTVVLKGPRTTIAFPDGELYRNPTGNAALAKGGTGDMLTGMMLGMLCCHENWRHAVLNAVYLHGACADEFIKTRSPHTMLARDIARLLPEVWKRFE
ncbi:NAD(P)H-hydrate dehydratase [Planococcus maitriensis]|uniref:ADP-dependent (S)-NAD(P)H-hydrate dehydratase n=1 Tax=Planococcus maitriensis TaxID=221799 RepID=A0A365K6N8_9BACL|nr:NAD(P)H-hydrate dehydratase [Planococcus maitriensis]RAZ68303.1 NAD(P)H-hydrate dehydratase [Planococcus maitriensis]